MPNIITITANSAIDLSVEIKHLHAGSTIKSESSSLFAAGKGVNVARTVEALKSNVTALGFVGQESLALFNGLDSQRIQTRFTAVAGKTRTNITLHGTENNSDTHIRTAGFKVAEKESERLLSAISNTITANDIVVLSGSLPEGLSLSFYDTVLQLCDARQALTLLDTDALTPESRFNVKPYLLKLNESEFSMMMGCDLYDQQDIAAAAMQVVRSGVTIVVVSMGEQGALIANRNSNTIIHASVSIEGTHQRFGAVGCGDAMLGGFSVGLAAGYSTSELIKLGVSCGTANLLSKQPGEIDFETVMGLCEKVSIREIKLT